MAHRHDGYLNKFLKHGPGNHQQIQTKGPLKMRFVQTLCNTRTKRARKHGHEGNGQQRRDMNVAEGPLGKGLRFKHPKRNKADGPGQGDDEAHPRGRRHGLVGRAPTHHHGYHKGRTAADAQQRGEAAEG